MKTIVVGDIHGKTKWKDILSSHRDNWDRFIFIGDYVDTHENITPIQQLENLREIIEFKKDNLDRVVLIIGNHDYHYWPGITESYSGYQPQMRASFEYEYKEFGELFAAAYADENNRIYTHAGLTVPFMKRLRFATKIEEEGRQSAQDIVRFVNDCFNNKPNLFGFYGGDLSGYGNDERQGCMWVRPQRLSFTHIVKMQIVGHTTMDNITPPQIGEMQTYFIDTLGTSGEYLFIEDKKINILK